jgi:flagellar basal-body rod protein FlgG
MIRGLYTSGWSMLANTKKMDVIANNMANVNTTGYKKDTVLFESFPNLLTQRINDTKDPLNPTNTVGNMQLSSDVGDIFTYYTQGQQVNTSSKLDFSINDYNIDEKSSPAFFTIGIPDGNNGYKEYYTRDGSFMLNSEHQLVTKDGNLVLGNKGAITLDNEDFSVDPKGNIIQNGNTIDTLRITQFADATQLRKFGNNLIQNNGSAVTDFQGSVTQGAVEQSNVNVITEMVDMITVMRAYETNQKMIQYEDGTLDKAINDVGVLR